MHPEQIFQRPADFEERAQNLRLRKSEWDLALAFDGLRSLSEIAKDRELDDSVLERTLKTLIENRLVEERLFSLQEIRDLGKKPESVQIVPGNGKAEKPLEMPVAITARIGARLDLPRRPIRPVIDSGEESNGQSTAPVATRKHFRLKPAIDFIIVQSGGGTLGQLAVYRVFMRVPTDLMKRSNIHSLSLIDENIEVTDPELQEAIMRAINQTMGVELPVDYFLSEA